MIPARAFEAANRKLLDLIDNPAKDVPVSEYRALLKQAARDQRRGMRRDDGGLGMSDIHKPMPEYVPMFHRYQCSRCHSWVSYNEWLGRWLHKVSGVGFSESDAE